MNILRRKIPVDAISGVLSRASNQIVTVIITLVATRFLSPTEFGVFAAATAFLILGRNLLYTGPFEYLLRSNRSTSELECLSVSVIVSILYSFIALVVGLIIFREAENNQILILLMILMPSVVVSAYTAWLEALILREGNISRYYMCTLITEIIGAVFIILMFLNGAGLKSLVLHQYFRTFVVTLLYMLCSPKLIFKKLESSKFFDIIQWSFARFGAATTQFFTNYGSDLLLASFYTPGAAGIYRASNRIVISIYDVLNQPLRLIVQTSTSRRFANGLAPDDQGLLTFSAFACVAWPGLTTLALIAVDIIPYVLGENWTQAGPIVAIFAIARCFTLLDSVLSPSLVAYGKQRILLINQISTCVIAIIGIVVLLPFGTKGAALATSIAGLTLTFLTAYQATKLGMISWSSIEQIIKLPLFITLFSLTGAISMKFLISDDYFSTPLYGVLSILLAAMVSWCVALFIMRRRLAISLATLRH